MRRPVPESLGTAAGAALLVGSGCAPVDAEALGRAAVATGWAPRSACVARTTTAAIAPTVRPDTQAHEGSRADTGTHLLSYGPLHTGVRSSYCDGAAGQSSTGSSSGR